MRKLFETTKGFSFINKACEGFSLIELLVVITVFAVLGLLSTQAILLTLRGANKSESSIKVRENLDYAVAVMERQLRNAESVTSCDDNEIDYKDINNNPATFSCVIGSGADSSETPADSDMPDTSDTPDTQSVEPNTGYIASSSARLTSSDIIVSQCSFSCTTAENGVPPSVTIDISAHEANKKGIESAGVTLTTEISLRTY